MTKRLYTGLREKTSGMSKASMIKKLEIQKGGKLPITSSQRYKIMMEEKLDENLKTAASKMRNNYTPPGAKSSNRTLSHKAEMALKQISQKKAMKKERELRAMVPIVPCNYQEGRLDAKGNIYDIQNNLVLRVNGKKKGKITTMTGWSIGKYKPKSLLNRAMISEAIKKHSPYYIKLRQMQMLEEQQRLLAMQQGGVHGLAAQMTLMELYGQQNIHIETDELQPNRTNLQTGAWGVMSNNVHGTYGENAWGTFADNIHGTASSNIWGTVSGSQIWGKRTVRVFGSGNGKNYLKPIYSIFTSLFNFRGVRNAFGGSRNSGRGRR